MNAPNVDTALPPAIDSTVSIFLASETFVTPQGLRGADGALSVDGAQGNHHENSLFGLTMVKSLCNALASTTFRGGDRGGDGEEGREGLPGDRGKRPPDAPDSPHFEVELREDGVDPRLVMRGASDEQQHAERFPYSIQAVLHNVKGKLGVQIARIKEPTPDGGYTVLIRANGSNGADGGRGGDGADGGKGGDGGDGEDGAAGPAKECGFPGGGGGNAGHGGHGGHGGGGGHAAHAGNGGHITVFAADPALFLALCLENKGGRGGRPGSGGQGGQGGSAGRPGKGGAGGSGTNDTTTSYESINPPAKNYRGSKKIVTKYCARDGWNGADGHGGVAGNNGESGKRGLPGLNGVDGRLQFFVSRDDYEAKGFESIFHLRVSCTAVPDDDGVFSPGDHVQLHLRFYNDSDMPCPYGTKLHRLNNEDAEIDANVEPQLLDRVEAFGPATAVLAFVLRQVPPVDDPVLPNRSVKLLKEAELSFHSTLRQMRQPSANGAGPFLLQWPVQLGAAVGPTQATVGEEIRYVVPLVNVSLIPQSVRVCVLFASPFEGSMQWFEVEVPPSRGEASNSAPVTIRTVLTPEALPMQRTRGLVRVHFRGQIIETGFLPELRVSVPYHKKEKPSLAFLAPNLSQEDFASYFKLLNAIGHHETIDFWDIERHATGPQENPTLVSREGATWVDQYHGESLFLLLGGDGTPPPEVLQSAFAQLAPKQLVAHLQNEDNGRGSVLCVGCDKAVFAEWLSEYFPSTEEDAPTVWHCCSTAQLADFEVEAERKRSQDHGNAPRFPTTNSFLFRRDNSNTEPTIEKIGWVTYALPNDVKRIQQACDLHWSLYCLELPVTPEELYKRFLAGNAVTPCPHLDVFVALIAGSHSTKRLLHLCTQEVPHPMECLDYSNNNNSLPSMTQRVYGLPVLSGPPTEDSDPQSPSMIPFSIAEVAFYCLYAEMMSDFDAETTMNFTRLMKLHPSFGKGASSGQGGERESGATRRVAWGDDNVSPDGQSKVVTSALRSVRDNVNWLSPVSPWRATRSRFYETLEVSPFTIDDSNDATREETNESAGTYKVDRKLRLPTMDLALARRSAVPFFLKENYVPSRGIASWKSRTML